MTIGKSVLALTFLSFGVTSSLAADITTIDTGRFDWSGAYAGVHAGTGKAEYEGLYDGNGNPADPDAGYAQDLSLEGGVYGIHAGYNIQSGDWVYGIEADITFMDWTDQVLERDGSAADFIGGEVSFLGSVRGRIGIAGNRHLLFATAGLAYAQASYTGYEGTMANPTESGTVNFNDIGLAVGGGAEWAMSDNLVLRVEGIYYHFGDRQDGSGLTSDADAGDFAEFVSAYTIRAGISYKF